MVVLTEAIYIDPQGISQPPTREQSDPDTGATVTVRNPLWEETFEITTDDRTSFPIKVGARLVVGLNTAERVTDVTT